MSRGPGLRAQRHGAEGEDAAVRHLTSLGYDILARNFKTRFGEVDIVARDGATIVYVEVKRRESSSHGSAAEFVSPAKMKRVVGAARIYAARHGLTERLTRFDVIAIQGASLEPIRGADRGTDRSHEKLQHHKGAFDAR